MKKSTKTKNLRVVIIDEKSSDKIRTADTEDNRNVTDIQDNRPGPATEDDSKGPLMKAAFNVVEDVLQAAFETVGEAKYYTRKVRAITHGEFTAEKGRRYIQKLISTCKHRVAWAFRTEFLRREDVIHSFYYIYRVSWSVPSAQFPLAIIFTLAYFTLKISKNKPLNRIDLLSRWNSVEHD
ncbi:A-kinase anchor protein 14 [Octodon degus]|uniref:A-kinase anchor protein 14 n=1 Tax=Octodon degus TaxID=10160 RepID=A0A6P6DNX4_OCTDE|nr:A-kinase anchor protein 14 [Octodon degus]